MNRLKQLALALQNHHDVYKKFPASSNQGSAKGVASVWWPLPGSAAATGAMPVGRLHHRRGHGVGHGRLQLDREDFALHG